VNSPYSILPSSLTTHPTTPLLQITGKKIVFAVFDGSKTPASLVDSPQLGMMMQWAKTQVRRSCNDSIMFSGIMFAYISQLKLDLDMRLMRPLFQGFPALFYLRGDDKDVPIEFTGEWYVRAYAVQS
jgi:hypothetical protein